MLAESNDSRLRNTVSQFVAIYDQNLHLARSRKMAIARAANASGRTGYDRPAVSGDARGIEYPVERDSRRGKSGYAHRDRSMPGHAIRLAFSSVSSRAQRRQRPWNRRQTSGKARPVLPIWVGRTTLKMACTPRGGSWLSCWFQVPLKMAERVGFEPTLEFPLNTLSKRAPSTTRPSLRFGKRKREESENQKASHC